MNEIIRSIEEAQLRKDLPKFNIGDTVKVQVRLWKAPVSVCRPLKAS